MTIDAADRARVLVEALPYIKRFHGQKVVIKLGGHAMERKDETLLDIVLLRYVGLYPVLVHGGGPEITAMSDRLGLKSEFVDGLRVTDAPTMEVVKMVLTGKISPDLVATINRLGGQAVGMSGEDGPSIIAEPENAALGFVGRVTQVNAHTARRQATSAAKWAAPPACAARMVVLIAPGPASSGTASGTTPDSSPLCSSLASSCDWRTPPAWAFSIASAIRSSTRPPPTRNAGRLAPTSCSNCSPTSAEIASTANTVTVTTRTRRARSASLRAAVRARKIGTARNGSRTAVSVTKKRA